MVLTDGVLLPESIPDGAGLRDVSEESQHFPYHGGLGLSLGEELLQAHVQLQSLRGRWLKYLHVADQR